MSVRTRIIGLGQKAAGDDGVGLAVLDELRGRSLPQGTALLQLADPTELVSLLAEDARVLLVDAVLAWPPGVVVELAPEELSTRALQPTSSHGLGAAQAIELARTLSPGAGADLRVVAVTIGRPERYATALSPEVRAAVPKAADRVLALVGG